MAVDGQNMKQDNHMYIRYMLDMGKELSVR